MTIPCATTMEFEREERIVSTNRKLSMDANRFVLSFIPMHGHSTHILRPTRVRDYGTKDFPHLRGSNANPHLAIRSRRVLDYIFFPL